MNQQETGAYRLDCRSCIPGRQRWEASPLRDRPTIARAAERYLSQVAGVRQVSANPVTGRILVRHDPAIPVARIAGDVRSVIHAIWVEYGDSRPAARGARFRQGFRRALVQEVLWSGGALLAQRILFGPASISALTVAGTGAAALAFAGLQHCRQRDVNPASGRQAGQAGSHPLARLMRHSRRHLPRVALASGASVANRLVEMVPPLLLGAAVDVVVNGHSSLMRFAGGGGSLGRQLGMVAGASVAVWGLESGLEYAQKVLWRDLSQAIQHDLRVAAYDHVQNLDMRYFEDGSVGDLASTLNGDVNQLELFFNDAVDDLLQGVTSMAVIGGVLMSVSPLASLAALAPIPLSIWGASRFQRRLAPLYAQAREQHGRVSGRLVNNLGGIATIKSFTAERYEADNVRAQSDVYVQKNSQANKLYAAVGPVNRIAALSGLIGTTLVGGRAVARGSISAGTFSLLVYMTQRIRWPMVSMGRAVDRYKRAMASASRVMDLLDIEPTLVDGSHSLDARDVRGHLVFDRLRFGYQPDAPVLQGLSFEVSARSRIAIVGETGCGKTTVVKLLLRFFDPDGGRVLLDGHDVRDFKLRDLRSAIGLVSQELFLFEGSVRDNIAYGNWSATDEEIVAAARSAEAHGFITALPERYDTLVGERGVRLSGGQRQRICLARAILKNPPILVLDEATSSVDNETEAAIQRSLDRVTAGRTTLIIAHRLSSVRHADRIYVLSHGRLVESGTHEALLERGGKYARLWCAQAGSEDHEPA